MPAGAAAAAPRPPPGGEDREDENEDARLEDVPSELEPRGVRARRWSSCSSQWPAPSATTQAGTATRSARIVGAREARERQDQRGQQRAEEDHRPEDVQEEREVHLAGSPDHQDEDHDRREAGAVVERVRRSGRGAAPTARRSARRLRRRGARRARASAPGGGRRCRRARSRRPRGRARSRSRRRRASSRSSCHSQMPKTSVPATPMKITGSDSRIRRNSAATSLGFSARSASTLRMPAATDPPTKRNAAATWSISSHSAVVTRASVPLQADGTTRTSPPSPDGDDRGRQLDARPPGGAVARRDKVPDALVAGRVLRLPLRRARRRARPARDARDDDRRDEPPPADAARRGDHRLGGRGARPGDARVAGASRSAVQALPEPARGRVRVDPRRADPHARRHARGRAQRPHAKAARVHPGRGRAAARDRGAGGAVDRPREALRGGAACA